MRINVNLTEAEREKVKRYANKRGLKMSKAYAELILEGIKKGEETK